MLPSELPLAAAPMAGGPSTPELVAAVADAGGYGFLAGGYLTAGQLHDTIAAARALTPWPLGVNLFVPSSPSDPAAVVAYSELVGPEAERLGVTLGDPRWEDDHYGEKVDVLRAAQVHLVSFTFGCPSEDDIDRLHAADVLVAVTVTCAAEALVADAAGADSLVVQGTEAGGHQGAFVDRSPNRVPLLDALGHVRDVSRLPLIAAGGVATGGDAAAALASGAVAVAIGTALLCAPEAGTSALQRRALLGRQFDDTVVTRAYTGRFARGLANRFALAYGHAAPDAYPEVHHLTRPLRAAAIRADDPEVPSLWAGTGWRTAMAEPAGTILRRIADDARRAQ